MSKSSTVVVEKALLKSIPFRGLSGITKNVLFEFLMKRVVAKGKAKPGAARRWHITNNGQIEYTYSEAEKKGIPRASFMRSIDKLVEHGFIDIAHSGSGGVKGDKSLYAISERWIDWGTVNFVQKHRKKDVRSGRGFQKGHESWRKIKTNIGIKIDKPPVIKTDNPLANQMGMECQQ